MQISARNQLPGTVKTLKKGPVNTEVVVVLAGGAEVVSVITTYSAEKLGLKEGAKVFAIMKASEVMLGID
jgi:molybdopterin-binding protein